MCGPDGIACVVRMAHIVVMLTCTVLAFSDGGEGPLSDIVLQSTSSDPKSRWNPVRAHLLVAALLPCCQNIGRCFRYFVTFVLFITAKLCDTDHTGKQSGEQTEQGAAV